MAQAGARGGARVSVSSFSSVTQSERMVLVEVQAGAEQVSCAASLGGCLKQDVDVNPSQEVMATPLLSSLVSVAVVFRTVKFSM